MKVTVNRWGNSLAVRIPQAAVEAAGLSEGAQLDMQATQGELVLRQRARYTLDDLLVGARREQEIDWGSELGNEVIHDDYS